MKAFSTATRPKSTTCRTKTAVFLCNSVASQHENSLFFSGEFWFLVPGRAERAEQLVPLKIKPCPYYSVQSCKSNISLYYYYHNYFFFLITFETI